MTTPTGSTSESDPESAPVRERLTDYSILADGGRALTLVGAPGPISHELEFHNSGEQRAILRQATLSARSSRPRPGTLPG